MAGCADFGIFSTDDGDNIGLKCLRPEGDSLTSSDDEKEISFTGSFPLLEKLGMRSARSKEIKIDCSHKELDFKQIPVGDDEVGDDAVSLIDEEELPVFVSNSNLHHRSYAINHTNGFEVEPATFPDQQKYHYEIDQDMYAMLLRGDDDSLLTTPPPPDDFDDDEEEAVEEGEVKPSAPNAKKKKSLLVFFSADARESCREKNANPISSTPPRGGVNKKIIKTKTKPVWKEAIDPRTGSTYYYHRKTRETSWSKPEGFIVPVGRPAKQDTGSPVRSVTAVEVVWDDENQKNGTNTGKKARKSLFSSRSLFNSQKNKK